MQTQWRAGGLGVIGLDYACLVAVAGLLAVELTPANLKKIMALEAATLARANERADR